MLSDWIKGQISANGPVTVAQFMEWALYHPQWGYYSRGPRIGPRGDFTTSPESSAAFGSLLALHIQEIDSLLGQPARLDVLECGPGRGTLARDVLSALSEEAPDVFRRTRYVMLEVSPGLRRQQEALLSDGVGARVTWISDLSELDRPIEGAIIGNEFLDAFPVHLLRMHERQLVELYVGLRPDGDLSLVNGSVSDPRLLAFARRYELHLSEGETLEVSLSAAEWLRALAGNLDRGIATFFDYGDTQPQRYSAARRQGTLLGYRDGAVSSDIRAFPGEQDLTALVDFTHMSDTALEAGFDLLGITRQATFLIGLGLGEGAHSPLAQHDVESALQFRKGLQSLISMEGLGRFHVMLLAKGIDTGKASERLSGLQYRDIL